MLSSLSRWIWSFRLRLGQAWRQWLRHERPSRLAVRWTLRDGLIVLLACLGVGLISAWPWLVQPSLRPGLPAPFEIRAPQDASVVDSEALAQRRSQLGPRIQVQITDQNATTKLERRLKRMLAELLNSRTAVRCASPRSPSRQRMKPSY